MTVAGVDTVESVAPEHPNLGRRKLRGHPKERKTSHIAGVAGDASFVSFNNNMVNMVRAVKERVFFVKNDEGKFVSPPKPQSGAFVLDNYSFLTELRHYLPSTARKTAIQFVESYTGRKRMVYDVAERSLRIDPWKVVDSDVKVFVKWEKLQIKIGKTLYQLVPRVISPRSPRFNVELGRFLKFLEKPLFKAVDAVFGEPTVMKGYNAEQVARILRQKWDSFNDPVAVGADASRFDQHVSQSALRWEHNVYAQCFQGHEARLLRRLLKFQLRNVCHAYLPDGSFHYKTVGGRMSGDMNTGMGNCLLMCAMMWSWFKRCGLKKFSLINNGDDCVMIVERRDLDRLCTGFTEWFRSMGFTMVVETPVDIFERIAFCQTQPVYDGRKWIMCRDLRAAISKDSVSMDHLNNAKEARAWLESVGMGGTRLTGGLPIFQNFYRAYLRASKGAKAKKKYELGRGMTYMIGNLKRGFTEPTPASRYSFYLAFGIPPDSQRAMEVYYDNLTLSAQPKTTSYWKRQLLF